MEWSLLSNNSDNKKAGLLLIRFEVFAHCKAFSIQPHPDHKIPWYKKMLRRLRMQTIQLKILWSDIKFIYLYLFCCFSIYLLKLASSAGNELQYLVVHNKRFYFEKKRVIVNQIQGSYTGYTISEQFSIILCDPNCKDDNARFLTVPFKP